MRAVQRTVYRQCASRAAEICACACSTDPRRQHETRLAALERRANEMETPVRDAFARFRRLRRRLKRLEDLRADTSRRVVECALELSKIVGGQRRAGEQGEAQGELRGDDERETAESEGGGGNGGDGVDDDDGNMGQIVDEVKGAGEGETAGKRRQHQHHVLVRSELLERADGMAPQLHQASHAAHRLRLHGRALQAERVRLKGSCRDARPLVRNAAVTLIQLHLRGVAVRAQARSEAFCLDRSRQRSMARIKARVAAREASLLRATADDPRRWLKLRVAPELRSLRLAEGFVDVRAWRRREWRMQCPTQSASTAVSAVSDDSISRTSASFDDAADISRSANAQIDSFGWGAEVEQLMDQRERWFIHLQRRTFGCGLPLAPSTEPHGESGSDTDSGSSDEFETTEGHQDGRSEASSMSGHGDVDRMLTQLTRAPNDTVQKQTKDERRRRRRALHVYCIEEFSNKPLGRVVKTKASKARRVSIHTVGAPPQTSVSTAEAAEANTLAPTVDSVVFEKKRLGVVLDTFWVHRRRFEIAADAPHHRFLGAHLTCLCDILRLRRACLIAGTGPAVNRHQQDAKPPLSLSDLRALSSATAGACLARRARIAVISRRLEGLRDELRRIRPVLACRHHAKHVQSHPSETATVSTKLTKHEMATEAVVHCHYCGCVTKAGFSYVQVGPEQSKLIDADGCENDSNENDAVRLEAALPRLDRVVAAAEAAAQALHREKQARRQAQLGSCGSGDQPHHGHTLTAEQQECEALRHAAMLAVREARIWLVSCRLERKIRQLATSRAAAAQKHGQLGKIFRGIDASHIQRIVRGFCARRGVARATRLLHARKQCSNRYALLHHSATARCSELLHTLKLEQQAKELHYSALSTAAAAAAAAALAVRDAARHAARTAGGTSDSAAIAAILTAVECAVVSPLPPAQHSGGIRLQRHCGALLLTELWRAHRLRKHVRTRCQAQQHAARELKCDKCGRTDFSSRHAFSEHMIAHARFDHRFCHRCGKRNMLSEEEIAAHAAEHAEADALLASAAQEHEQSKHLMPAALKQQRRNLLLAERAFSDSLSKLQESAAMAEATPPHASPLAAITASRGAEMHAPNKDSQSVHAPACNKPKTSDQTVRRRWDKLSSSLDDLGALLDGQRAVQRPLVQRPLAQRRERDQREAQRILMMAPASPHIPRLERLAEPAGKREILRHDPARVYGVGAGVEVGQHNKLKPMKPTSKVRKGKQGKGSGRRAALK